MLNTHDILETINMIQNEHLTSVPLQWGSVC